MPGERKRQVPPAAAAAAPGLPWHALGLQERQDLHLRRVQRLRLRLRQQETIQGQAKREARLAEALRPADLRVELDQRVLRQVLQVGAVRRPWRPRQQPMLGLLQQEVLRHRLRVDQGRDLQRHQDQQHLRRAWQGQQRERLP